MARKRYKKRNPTLSLRPPLSAVTAGFKPSTIIGTVPTALGVVLGLAARKFITSRISFLSGGLPSYAAGLIGAGIMGAIGSRVSPKWGASLLFGGVLGEVIRFGNSVVPAAYQIPGLSGVGDYLMGDYMEGMGDYLSGIGDYIGEEPTGPMPEVDVGASDADLF